MRWLKQWRRGPIAALIAAWIVCVGATLTVYIVAQARSAERMFREMGFRLGATAAQAHINWPEMLPQLVAYYVVIVFLPPAVLWLLWRRSRAA